MRKSRFTKVPIVSILKQTEGGLAVNEVYRQHGISSATYYPWKSKYGGLDASEWQRFKDLDTENTKLKRMYAGRALENTALKAWPTPSP